MADEDGARRRAFTLKPRTIGAGAIGVLLALFWSANRNRVEVSFLFFDATVRVWVALLVASLVGLALGMLLARRRR